MIQRPLTEMPGSRFFHDFLDNKTQATSRFPHLRVTPELMAARAAAVDRAVLASVMAESVQGLEQSDAQRAAVQRLQQSDSVAVVTGQQVGLLGGPMYTLLKIRSAVVMAEAIAGAVPVFWLEDNDHDAEEASTTALIDATGQAFWSTIWDGSQARLPVAQRTYSAQEMESLAAILPHLHGEHATLVQQELRSAIHEGASWADAFLSILQPYLSAWGVVVVRASIAIRAGVHSGILQNDLGNPGELSGIIAGAGGELEARGYHVQATPPKVMFFHHDQQGRQRIDTDTTALMHLPASEFSPSALSRPMVQDTLLPTVATVLGPAELAYHAQLREAYEHLGIAMPVPTVRHSGTIVDARTERNLGKEQISALQVMRPWQELEREMVALLADDVIPTIDSDAVEQLFAPFVEAASGIDSTLVQTVHGARSSTTSALETLTAKLRSALKKKSSLRMDRLRAIHTALYPFDAPQERSYPLSFWEARTGQAALRVIVERLCTLPRGMHGIVNANGNNE